MNISPEAARANIVAAYTKQHQEGVSVLSAAIERVRSNKAEKVKPETEKTTKPELSKLLLELAQEAE
jgi:hypothetical protein